MVEYVLNHSGGRSEQIQDELLKISSIIVEVSRGRSEQIQERPGCSCKQESWCCDQVEYCTNTIQNIKYKYWIWKY